MDTVNPEVMITGVTPPRIRHSETVYLPDGVTKTRPSGRHCLYSKSSGETYPDGTVDTEENDSYTLHGERPNRKSTSEDGWKE